MDTLFSRLRAWLLLGALACFSLGANATLIGDGVDVCHYFPDAGSPYGCAFTVVAPDASDVVVPNPDFGGVYTVDMHGSGFLAHFLFSGLFTTSSFNGLVLTSLDWVDMPDGFIVGLLIETNMAGWDDSLASFGPHSAAFNWSGLSFDPDTFFRVEFLTRHGVPLPATLLLFGLGLAALRFHRVRA